MFKDTELKVRHRGPLQWHDISIEFHRSLLIGSIVDVGDRQDDDLIRLKTSYNKRSHAEIRSFTQKQQNWFYSSTTGIFRTLNLVVISLQPFDIEALPNNI
jgi:hypothetical protein